jgi:hypothetical protein
MYDPYRFTIQRTNQLIIKQCEGGWIIWIAGTPITKHHSYLILYNDGRVEQHTIAPDGDGKIKVIQAHSTT